MHKDRKIGKYAIKLLSIQTDGMARSRRWAVVLARTVYMAVRRFFDDECMLHSSALTFSSLMAIVPILALSLAIARGMGGTELAKDSITGVVNEWTANLNSMAVNTVSVSDNSNGNLATLDLSATEEQEDIAQLSTRINLAIELMFEKVNKINFAALGGVGLIVLLWMVIDVFAQVEQSFNKVWGVKKGRTLVRKFSDYLSAVIVLPFLMIMASTIPVMDFVTRYMGADIAGQVRAVAGSGALKGLMTIVMTTLCFTFLIKFMPNTSVRLRPALVGGLVTAILFILWLWLCAAFQVSVIRFSRLYGSFAMVPILLTWVFVSWEIILFGAEVTSALQEPLTTRIRLLSSRLGFKTRISVALDLLSECARSLLGKGSAVALTEFAVSRGVSLGLVAEVAGVLSANKYISSVGREDTDRYVMILAPPAISLRNILSLFIDDSEMICENMSEYERKMSGGVIEKFNSVLDDRFFTKTFQDYLDGKS